MVPIGRRSLVDGVVEELQGRILRGEMRPGETLPAELELAEKLGVSRTAVREALNRLAAARLVSIRHSGAKYILDYRHSAGLELLAALLVGPRGQVASDVVRSVMEMRSALAPDIARLAARRRTPAVIAQLRAALASMQAARTDLAALQDLVGDFWSHLVDGSANIAYRLAYNSLRASYDQSKSLLTHVLADETADIETYVQVTDAVERGDEVAAAALASQLVRRGETSMNKLLDAIQPLEETHA